MKVTIREGRRGMESLVHPPRPKMQASPTFVRLALEVDDDPARCFSPDPGRLIHMTEMDLRDFLPCPNRRCHAGGLNLAGVLASALAQGASEISDRYHCDGYEHHGPGRRVPCGNSFRVKAVFEVS